MPPERSSDPTKRFTDRARAYAQARPGYAPGLAPTLARELRLGPDTVVADLGAGTGLSAEPLLRAGWRVLGVEPNAGMRAEAEQLLAPYPGFRAVDGRAEATGLAAGSVDLVLAAQAFHWFDVPAARREALRILRDPPRAALVWNDRRETGSAFAVGYERLLQQFGTDYAEVRHRHGQLESIEAFFGAGGWRRAEFPNPTALDFDTLAARLASASYVPGPDSPAHGPMMAGLRLLFDATQRDGHVVMEYDTHVYFGVLRPPSPPESP